MAEFDIMYNRGISFVGDLIDLATKYEITRKSGAFYSYKELKLGQGRENVKTFLEDNLKIQKEIEKELKAHINKLKEDAGKNAQNSIAAAKAREAAEVESENALAKVSAAAASKASSAAKSPVASSGKRSASSKEN